MPSSSDATSDSRRLISNKALSGNLSAAIPQARQLSISRHDLENFEARYIANRMRERLRVDASATGQHDHLIAAPCDASDPQDRTIRDPLIVYNYEVS